MHYQGQKREQKHTTKNFVEFHNHSPPLTTIITTFTNYKIQNKLQITKYSHGRYLQYNIATHIINNTTTVYTTYNTIQYLHHYY